ncbi:hypothetical protein [Rhodopseudomonas telluris]|uniref:Uncharacterized protein n=1 Tax=Rhodopseudomonas telluris TaxID=644215 RepID=A0ABV6EQU4_9BRAD
MQRWIGAAIVAVALGLTSAASAQPSASYRDGGTQISRHLSATEFSSRHRGRAHAQRPARRHSYRHGTRHRAAPPAAARPYGARPDGMAPFFPFGFGGYGFQPSW